MIEESNLKKNLMEFSFPRLSGTEHEKKAFDLLKKKLEELKANYETENFSFSSFYSRLFPKISFISIWFLLLVLFLKIENLFLSIAYYAVFISFIIVFRITRKPEKIKLGKRFNSQNLYIRVPNDSKKNNAPFSENAEINDDKTNIVFICHVDSKGQKLPIVIRTLSNLSWFLSFPIILLIIILRIFNESILLFYFGLFFIAVNLSACIFIMFNFTNNKSLGAIDNASGVSCGLELLNFYLSSSINLKNINLLFAFTGAEECGTMGVRYFYNKIKNKNKDKIIIHNFESLAKNVYIYVSKHFSNPKSDYLGFFKDNSKKRIFNFIPGTVAVGFHTDGVFLMHKGFQVLEFESSKIGWFMHTSHDTPDKVDELVLKEVCETIVKSIEDYDKLHDYR